MDLNHKPAAHIAAYYTRQAYLAGMFSDQRRFASDHAGYRAALKDMDRFKALAHEAAQVGAA